MKRQNDIIITGLAAQADNVKDKVDQLLSSRFNVSNPNEVNEVTLFNGNSGKIRVSLVNVETKKQIMKSKKIALNNTKIYIDPDLSEVEREIEGKLRAVAKSE